MKVGIFTSSDHRLLFTGTLPAALQWLRASGNNNNEHRIRDTDWEKVDRSIGRAWLLNSENKKYAVKIAQLAKAANFRVGVVKKKDAYQAALDDLAEHELRLDQSCSLTQRDLHDILDARSERIDEAEYMRFNPKTAPCEYLKKKWGLPSPNCQSIDWGNVEILGPGNDTNPTVTLRDKNNKFELKPNGGETSCSPTPLEGCEITFPDLFKHFRWGATNWTSKFFPPATCRDVNRKLEDMLGDAYKNSGWKAKRVFGAGSFGQVFGVERNGTTAAMKVMREDMQKFRREMKYHLKFSELNMAPPIWNNFIFIPRERYKPNKAYLMDTISGTYDDIMFGNVSTEEFKNAAKQYIRLVQRAAENGYLHGDGHSGNIAIYKKRLMWIDFGRSIPLVWPALDYVQFIRVYLLKFSRDHLRKCIREETLSFACANAHRIFRRIKFMKNLILKNYPGIEHRMYFPCLINARGKVSHIISRPAFKRLYANGNPFENFGRSPQDNRNIVKNNFTELRPRLAEMAWKLCDRRETDEAVRKNKIDGRYARSTWSMIGKRINGHGKSSYTIGVTRINILHMIDREFRNIDEFFRQHEEKLSRSEEDDVEKIMKQSLENLNRKINESIEAVDSCYGVYMRYFFEIEDTAG